MFFYIGSHLPTSKNLLKEHHNIYNLIKRYNICLNLFHLFMFTYQDFIFYDLVLTHLLLSKPCIVFYSLFNLVKSYLF